MNRLDQTLKSVRGSRAKIVLASAAINLLSLAFPVAMLQIYDRIIPHAAIATLAYLSLALLISLALDFVLSTARSYLSAWNAARVQHQATYSLIQHMFRSDLRAFEKSTPGVHLQRLRAIDTLKNVYAGQGLLLIVDMPFVVIFLGLIGLIGGYLVLVPIGIITTLAVASHFANKYLEKALEARRECDTRRYNFTIEVLQKIYTIKALGTEDAISRRYELLQSNSATASLNVVNNGSWSRDTGMFFSQLASIAVGAYGAELVMNNSMTVGGLAACVLLTTRATQPMMRALGTWGQLRKGQTAERQISEILSLPAESAKAAEPLVIHHGSLELDNISFSYTTPEKPIIHDLSLAVHPGEAVSISAPDDSGKSTLVGLMMGTLAPLAGCVRIDGEEIENYDKASIRRQIVYLPEASTLFRGTILENLTMFRGDAFADSAMRMAERLGLHEVIGRMPLGYDTHIEHAANDGLSDSVRQRIAVARALTLVEDPRMIIFDEANNSLGDKSNAKLLTILAEYKPTCSMVIISEDPAYIALCDRSYNLNNKTLTATAPLGRKPVDMRERVSA